MRRVHDEGLLEMVEPDKARPVQQAAELVFNDPLAAFYTSLNPHLSNEKVNIVFLKRSFFLLHYFCFCSGFPYLLLLALLLKFVAMAELRLHSLATLF